MRFTKASKIRIHKTNQEIWYRLKKDRVMVGVVITPRIYLYS
jgi:hypothetical protein